MSNSASFPPYSNDLYRGIAFSLIQASVEKNRQLDREQLNLDKLRELTNNKANEMAHTSRIVNNIPSDHARVLQLMKGQAMRNLTLATREVLRIIPEDQWQHNRGHLAGIDAEVGTDKSYKPDTGLHCVQMSEDGKTENEIGYIDPNKSLASQRVSCTRPSAATQKR